MADRQPSAADIEQKPIVDRLPSISGWITERNVFRILADACLQGFHDSGQQQRIGVIRGPDFSSLDGGLIFDPPEGYPMDMDPSKAWAWINEYHKGHEHEDYERKGQILPIDVKLSVTARSAYQIAPIFIVAPPSSSNILCILPVNSYAALHTNMKLEYHDSHTLVKKVNKSNKAHRLRVREPQHISSLLAPFAVQHRDIFKALLSLKDALNNQSIYTNPSNGVRMRGWVLSAVAGAAENSERLTTVLGERQKFSANTIQMLTQTLRRAQPECQMELLFNLVQPLGCDLVLRDDKLSTAYLIEHKTTTPRESKSDIVTLRPASEWINDKLNWHFLFHQHGDWLAIHTREGHKVGSNTPAVRVDMRSPDAASIISNTIRSHGSLAKQRLQAKWRDFDLFEASMSDNVGKMKLTAEEKSPVRKQSTRTIAAPKEQFRIAFCDAINDQCYKLRKHACIILEGNACGDAAIIQHNWTELDAARYEANRTLPVSLFTGGQQSGSSNALVLRFISHSWPPRVPPSQLFEPARIRTIEIPLCMGQPFIYVAATISSPSAGEPSIDKLILLPSGDTNWSVKYKGCKICEDDDDTSTRNRRPVIQTLGEGQGAGQPGSSFVQLPFLSQHAEPLRQIYDFIDGSVHERLDVLLSDPNYVVSINGPQGLLQRQWNHGSPRMHNTGSSATQTMMRRVLTTLPPNTKPMASDHIEPIHAQMTKDLVKKNSYSETRAKEYAHQAILSDDAYGMSLASIMAQSGFHTKYTLRCDHCETEETCRFYLPEIAYSRKATPSCAGCYTSKHTCTFYGIANTPELVDMIRNYELLRRHVPCNECFANGKICDNRANTCGRCESSSKKCVREACKNRSEPGDESNCPKDCDLAHDDDGYTNMSRISRPQGYNARLRSQQEAQKIKNAS